MPCSIEQCTQAVSSEAEIGNAFFPWMDAFRWMKMEKRESDSDFILFFLCMNQKNCSQWVSNTLLQGIWRTVFRNLLHLFCRFKAYLIYRFVTLAPCPLDIFLYFGDSIFSLHDTFSHCDTLVTISFESQGDQGDLSTSVCHTL